MGQEVLAVVAAAEALTNLVQHLQLVVILSVVVAVLAVALLMVPVLLVDLI